MLTAMLGLQLEPEVGQIGEGSLSHDYISKSACLYIRICICIYIYKPQGGPKITPRWPKDTCPARQHTPPTSSDWVDSIEP